MTGEEGDLSAYQKALDELNAESMGRTIRTYATEGPVTFRSDQGQKCVSFCLNDYLGLRLHPEVVRAATEVLATDGAGAAASMLAGGHRPVHRELEYNLARFKGTEACRVTSSGYTAALAAIQALVETPHGIKRPVIFDRLTHACLLDGIRLHGPHRNNHSFRHNDPEDLERQLRKLSRGPGEGKAGSGEQNPASPAPLVVMEGLYSMDGDDPPLAPIADLCDRYGAWLLIDDAHATGTRGPGGRGSLAAAGISAADRPIVVLGTLSKALGAMGGFVAGPQPLLDWMANKSRAYLFDTGLAPACAAAALAALGIIESEPQRVDHLRELCAGFRHDLVTRLGNSDPQRSLDPGIETIAGPIFPLIVGSVGQTVRLHQHLLDAGFQTAAIRPPTVRPGTSRIRIAINSSHTPQDLRGIADSLQQWIARKPHL